MTGRGKAMMAALALLATGAGGCAGFTPLYAQGGVVERMSKVSVEVADSRTGYLLRESLDDALARDRQAPALYRLNVSMTEHRYPRGLQLDDTANSYELAVDVAYTLTDLTSGAVILNKAMPVTVTYAATDQPYAGIVAQEDSQTRAARQTAEIIKTDLAAFFAGRP